MHADLPVTAAFSVHKGTDKPIAFPAAFLFLLVLDLSNKECQESGVALLPKQQAIGGQAVAARAARFLVVLLDRFRQRKVNDGADSSLVDAQAKRNGADQHADFIRHPALLVTAASVGVHLAVIGDGGNSLLGQKIDGLLDFADGRRINNHVAVRISSERAQQKVVLGPRVHFLHHVPQIWPVETGDALMRIAQAELVHDVVPHAPRGAGGKRSNGMVGEMLPQTAQLPVFRTELVAPFGNAVRFIDSK